MQTFNSFDSLANARSISPLIVSSMSVFNTGALSDSFKDWFEQRCVGGDFEAKDITFADVLQMVQAGESMYCFFAPNKGILGSDVRKAIFAELSDRSGIDGDVLYSIWSKANENQS